MRFLSIFLILLACNKRIAPTAPALEPINVPTTTIPKTTPDTPKPASTMPYVMAKIRRTPCFGKCPFYEAMVYSDGKVVYSGKGFVDKMGNYQGKVPPEMLKELLSNAEAIRFFKLEKQYPKNGKFIPDVPNTITYIKINNIEHEITDNADSPTELQQFEQFFDTWLERVSWKKITDKE